MDPTTLITLAAVIAAGYFLMVRPAQKRQREQQATMNALEPGVRIMTTAGVFATIVHMGTKQAVIEIAPGVEMTVLKQAIAKTVAPEDEEFEYEDSASPESSDGEPTWDLLADQHARFADAIKGFDGPDATDPRAASDDASAPEDGTSSPDSKPSSDPKNQ